MWPHRYFGARYFSDRYFPSLEGATIVDAVGTGGDMVIPADDCTMVILAVPED